MTVLVFLLCAFFGAGLNRHRGGWLPTWHTQMARSDYALGLAMMAMALACDWRLIALWPAFFIGSLSGNAGWFLVRSIEELADGMWSGFVNVALPAAMLGLVLISSSPWIAWGALLAAGLAKGPIYWLAGRIPSNVPALRTGPEIGEALYGAALGLALATLWLV